MRQAQFIALVTILTICTACSLGPQPPDDTPEDPLVATSILPTTAPVLILPNAVVSTNGITTITFATQATERQVYAPLAKKFTDENPTMHVQIITNDDPSNVSQAIRSADTALVYFDTSLVQSQLVRSNAMLDLKPLIESDANLDRTDFISNTLAPASEGEGVYMLPRILGISLLAYNKDLWAQRGLPTPQPNMSWKALLDVAAALKGTDNTSYGLLDSSPFIPALNRELQGSGIDFSTMPMSQLHLDSAAFSTALDHIATLVRSKTLYIPALANHMIGNDAIDKKLGQQINAQQIGIWDYVFNTPFDPPPSFKIGLLPGLYPYRGGTEGYIISKGTPNPEAAYRWISFLSNNEPAAFYESDFSNVPARNSFAKRIGYWDKLAPEDAAIIRATLGLPPAPRRVPDTIDRDHADILVNAVNAVVSGKQSATQAAADAQAAVEQVLAVATPIPSPTPAGPVVVATPIPEITQPNAVPISFSAPGLPADELAPLVQRFATQHPEIAVRVQSATGNGTLPALARTNDCFISFQTPQLGEDGALLDMQPLADADATFQRADYPAAALARFQRGGRLVGLPLRLGLPALHVNQAVLDQAGVATLAADWSLDAFRAAAEQANSGRGENRTYGFATSDGSYALNVWFQQSGVLPAQEQNGALVPTFTTPAVQAAIESYLALLRTSSPHTHLTGYTREPLADESATPLSQGRVAFWLDPQDRYGSTEPVTATGTLAPLPQDAHAVPNFTVAAAGYIGAQSKQPEACWQWLRFLSAEPSLLVGTYPARASQASAAQSDTPAGGQAVYAAAAPTLARPGTATDVFDDPRLDLFWFYRAVDHALGGKELARELADAQTTTASYLACVQSGTAGAACATQVDPSYAGFQQAAP